jgi:hypothetical protein
MTTASIRTTVHESVRPHGIERLAVQFGLALVHWGRVRAERSAVTRDQHVAMLHAQRAIDRREHESRRYGIAS